MPTGPSRRWVIRTTDDVRQWLRALRQSDPQAYRSVNVAIDMLAENGPGLGRPLVDTLQGSAISNLKELRLRAVGRTATQPRGRADERMRATGLVKAAPGTLGAPPLQRSSWRVIRIRGCRAARFGQGSAQHYEF